MFHNISGEALRNRRDALDDACLDLRLAIEALRAGGQAQSRAGDIEALREVASSLAAERDAATAALARMDCAEQRALAREYRLNSF